MRDRRTGLPRSTARDYPAGTWILPPQAGLEEALERGGGGPGARLRQRGRRCRTCRATTRPLRGSACGCRGPTPTPSAGCATPSTSAACPTPTCATRTSARRPARAGRRDRLRQRGPRPAGADPRHRGDRRPDGVRRHTRVSRASADRSPRTTSPAASAGAGLAALKRFVEEGGILLTLGNGSALVLEGGLVRYVRRAWDTGIRTPGAELRARFLKPEPPPRLRLSGTPPRCSAPTTRSTTCRAAGCAWPTARRVSTGRSTMRWVVLQWGTALQQPRRHDAAGPGGEAWSSAAAPWTRSELAGRPAILAVPSGDGIVVAYNFNPMHRDLNRSDYRLLWNAILNWRSLRSSQNPRVRSIRPKRDSARAHAMASHGLSAPGSRAANLFVLRTCVRSGVRVTHHLGGKLVEEKADLKKA